MFKSFNNLLQHIHIRFKLIGLIIIAGILPMMLLIFFFSMEMKSEFDSRQQLSLDLAHVQLENILHETFSATNHMINDLSSEIMDSQRTNTIKPFIEIVEQSLNQYNFITDVEWYQNSFESSEYVKPYDEIINTEWYDSNFKNAIISIPSQDYSIIYWITTFNRESVLAIRIETKKIKSLWENPLLSDLRAKILFVDEQGNIVSNNANIYAENEVFQTFNGDDYHYDITYEGQINPFEEFNGWKYYMFINEMINVSSFWQKLIALIFYSLLIAIALILLSISLSGNINKRLTLLNESMSCDQIDDLKVLPNLGHDEIGKTALIFNAMVLRMKELVLALQLEKEKSDQLLVEKTLALAHTEEHLRNLESKNHQINELIHIDPLTGLQNRFDIMMEIKKYIKENTNSFAVLFFDIDNFKYINDTYGHDLGDQVIVATSNLLKSLACEHMKIGRFGGDEFLVIINTSEIDLSETVKKIQEKFLEPVIIDQNKFYLTSSVGVSLYPDHGEECQILIQKADMALYQSQAHGKNMMTLYDASLSENLEERILFQNMLKEAYQNDEFVLNYQPVYNLSDSKVVGFEALIRWYSPILGAVSPYKLIKEAENIGLIVELGEWIFDTACQFTKQLQLNGFKHIKVNINISMIQLMSQGFVDKAIKMTRVHDIDPSMIVLEMTETVLIQSLEQSKSIIDALRQVGFGLALDDFGTGYSSLNYLKQLPVQVLKIDRSFIANIENDVNDIEFIKLITTIAHQRGLTVIAEGIEDQEQLNLLKACAVDEVQGYFFSEPISEIKAFNLILKK
ncbi:MAG: bifunctional diguanylate cyclase/phosphodiesterase [Clostridia bacterium]|nr:bifunctional diguanylate cyclase/phosphodiesterase [Clostridia bacterium]